MKTFGEQLKNLRIDRELTLRQCSEQIGVDPSNWSKFERGVNPAPKDIAILESWAAFFGLRGAAKQEFFDAAALSRRELPADIASDDKVLAALPAFFRAVRGAELDEAQLKQFVEDVRALHSPDRQPRE
jgi:transcriptional regulator with XRE-family HTH domain